MGVVKKIVHVLAIISYFLIALYVIVCVPLLFGYRPVVVLSGSMEPTYKVGSVIYYKKVSENDLKVGDTITFRLNGEFVSHRIVSIDDGLLETKGDANNVADANKISYESIEGKVAHKSIPYLGYYIKGINDRLLLFVIFFVIILVSEFLLGNRETFDINQKNERSEDYGTKKE